jgi:hypothetical protein
MRRGGFARPSWPTGAPAWAGGGGDVLQNRQPMAQGGSPADECVQVAWHRPRPLARIMSLRSIVATALASDRGVFQCLGVRSRSGYGGDDVAHGVRRRAGAHALAPNRFEQPFSN